MRNVLLSTAAAIGMLWSVSSHAADFVFVHPHDESRIFKPTDQLVIELPQNLSSAELGSLFIELNGIDITQVVTLEGSRVVFYPSSPYTAGSNSLRLVRMGKNGKLVEIRRWGFVVEGGVPPVERPGSLRGNVDATYSYMPWETNRPGTAPERHNLGGQMQIEGDTLAGNWQLSARGNGFFNTDSSLNPSRDPIEVGEYLLTAERPSETVSALLRLGNHDIGARNLLVNNFYRRGASAGLSLYQDTATITGFAQNPAPAIGNNNITGVSEKDQRVQGVRATLRPIASMDEKFELEGTTYQGRGVENGAGVFSVLPPGNKGNGYQLGVTTSLVENYLAMRTQYAQADFDFDGAHTGFAAQDDDSQRVSFLISPLGSTVDDEGMFRLWNLELAYQKVGTFFDTLTNPDLITDRKTYSLTSNYISGGFTLDGEISWYTDNVNDLPDFASNGALSTWAQGSYAPTEEYFGHPVFFAGGTFTDEARRKTPTGYTGFGLNRSTYSANGGVSMNFDSTVGTLTHTFTRLVDSAETTDGYTSNFTDLTLEFRATDWATLRPGLQYQVQSLDNGIDSDAIFASLGAELAIVPGTFWNYTNYSMLVNGGDTSIRDNYNLDTEFTWQIKQAEVNSPGYAVALAGLYGNLTDPTTGLILPDKDARVFLKLKFAAPFAY